MFCKKIKMAHEEWIKSLANDQEAQSSNFVQEVTFELIKVEDINIRIFCDAAVNKEKNKLAIGCIVYNKENNILARI